MTVLSFMKPYQKAAKDEATKDLAVEEEYKKDGNDIVLNSGSDVEEEAARLFGSGYGSVVDKEKHDGLVSFDPATDFGSGLEPESRRKKRWALLLVGAVLYVAGVAYWNSNKLQGLNESTQDVDLLGSSKLTKKEKDEAKAKKKAEKEKEKEDKEAAKKKKEAEKAEAKKQKEADKEAAKKEKEDAKIAAKASIYSSYPGCPGDVDIKYIKTPMAFEDHEIFANATGCHLASIHSLEELTKISHDGLFKMSFGPEIAMSFMSGKPLAKEFWLGGYLMDGDLDEMEWTDGSDYDYGPDWTNATEGWYVKIET
jgi:hypothetical protein